MAVGDCWLAIGSCRVGNGVTPSARDQQAHLIRGSLDPFWVILGHFGAIWALEVAATQREASRLKRPKTGQHVPETAPEGPFDPPQAPGTTFESFHFGGEF